MAASALGCAMLAGAMLAVALAPAPARAQAPALAQAEPVDRAPPEVKLPDPMPAIPAEDARLTQIGGDTGTYPTAIDPESIAIDDSRVVRFTLVLTSRSGVRNISYEALRCDVPERRLMALGRPDGTWSPARGSNWQRIRFDNSLHRAHADLYRSICTFGRVGGRTPADVLRQIESNPFRTY